MSNTRRPQDRPTVRAEASRDERDYWAVKLGYATIGEVVEQLERERKAARQEASR